MGTDPLAAGIIGAGAYRAGGNTLIAVLELVRRACSQGLAFTIKRLVSVCTFNTEFSAKASMTVSTARLASTTERVWVVRGSAVVNTGTV